VQLHRFDNIAMMAQDDSDIVWPRVKVLEHSTPKARKSDYGDQTLSMTFAANV